MPAPCDSRLIVILNDNDMSIAPPVGAMSAYLARLVSGAHLPGLRRLGKQVAKRLPKFFYDKAKRTEEYARGFWTGGTLFEELGFYYVGPIDGHNLDHLLPVLQNVRDRAQRADPRPCRDPEGQGLRARRGVRRQVSRRRQVRRRHRRAGKAEGRTRRAYTRVFAESLIEEARAGRRRSSRSPRRCRPAPASTSSPSEFPARTLRRRHRRAACGDLRGRARQRGLQAVLRASTRPSCSAAYDQVVHDVAIQNLPVRFAIDRAGLVGADGPTHAGAFDVAYLACLPGLVVMAAADEAELVHMVATAAALRRRADRLPLSARRGRRHRHAGLRHAARRSARAGSSARAREVALLSLGTRLAECLKAAEDLEARGPVDDGRRRPLRQAARRRADPAPRARARGAGHGRGGLRRRLRQPGPAPPGRDAASSTGA